MTFNRKEFLGECIVKIVSPLRRCDDSAPYPLHRGSACGIRTLIPLFTNEVMDI